MNFTWLHILNNFCSFTYIDLLHRELWKESKIFRIYGLLSLFFVTFNFFAVNFTKAGLKMILNPTSGNLDNYSNFSKFILFTGIKGISVCGLTVLIFQYYRRKSITKFLGAIAKFELSVYSKNLLEKKCILNTIIFFGYGMLVIFTRNFLIFRRDNVIAYITWISEFFVHIIIFTSFNFYCNFKQFLVIALKEVHEDLQDFEYSSKKLKKAINKFINVNYLLEIFENIFDIQFTTIIFIIVYLFVAFVSSRT